MNTTFATMAKLDKSSLVSYPGFDNEEQFFRWVATNHGTNISMRCQTVIHEKIAALEARAIQAGLPSVAPLDAAAILDELLSQARKINVAATKFRARFVW